jgi:hypothetical protein
VGESDGDLRFGHTEILSPKSVNRCPGAFIAFLVVLESIFSCHGVVEAMVFSHVAAGHGQ